MGICIIGTVHGALGSVVWPNPYKSRVIQNHAMRVAQLMFKHVLGCLKVARWSKSKVCVVYDNPLDNVEA